MSAGPGIFVIVSTTTFELLKSFGGARRYFVFAAAWEFQMRFRGQLYSAVYRTEISFHREKGTLLLIFVNFIG